METTEEQLDDYSKVEYIFGDMLLDPKVQSFFGADDRIAADPDINKVAIASRRVAVKRDMDLSLYGQVKGRSWL